MIEKGRGRKVMSDRGLNNFQQRGGGRERWAKPLQRGEKSYRPGKKRWPQKRAHLVEGYLHLGKATVG